MCTRRGQSERLSRAGSWRKCASKGVSKAGFKTKETSLPNVAEKLLKMHENRSRLSLHLHSLLFFRRTTTREVEESTQCTVSSMPAFHFDSFSSGNWRKLQTRIKTMQERQPHGKILITRRLALHLFPFDGFSAVDENSDVCSAGEAGTLCSGAVRKSRGIDKSRAVMCFVNKLHTTGRKDDSACTSLCTRKCVETWRCQGFAAWSHWCMPATPFAVVALDNRFHPFVSRDRGVESSWKRNFRVQPENAYASSAAQDGARGETKNLFRTRLRFDMHRYGVDPPNATHTRTQNKKNRQNFACLCSARWMTVQLLHF